MREKLIKILQQVSLRLLFATVTFFIALYVFALVTDEVIFDKEKEFDDAVFHLLRDDLTPGLIRVMRFFTFFGKPDFLIPAYLLLILYFGLRRKRQYAIETAIMGGSSTVLLFGLKALFQRKRPDFPLLEELSGFSFPSGHALLMFVFCSMLIYFVWNSHMQKGWKWFLAISLLLFSLLVGISRIILRVHFASDVIAGFALGYAWVIVGLWVQRNYMNHKKLLTNTADQSRVSAG